MRTTRIFKDNFFAYREGKRRVLNEGGTYTSKTWSILQLLTLIAEKNPVLISVVSESLPHLKRGAIRDFFNILGESQDNNPYWNKTECKYSGPDWKGIIEFFGADEAAKVRGPRRDILFINEANNVPWETARGLDIRTAKFTFVDWNPVAEFWAHEYWIGQPENAYVHSTYLDALAVLLPEVIANIESNKDKDPNWWNIYGLGLIGKTEGLVYPLFSQCDSLPLHGELIYGLDFGFSDDPAVLTEHNIFTEEIYSRELFYERGLTNQDIGHMMTDLGVKAFDLIWADSAEPKSIEEIYRLGFNIKGAPKGPGSVEYGHQKVRQYKQYWTKDSLNCIKEQRNYRYLLDKNGKLIEKTTHIYSHGMDSRRYAVMGFSEEPEPEESVIIYDAMEAVRDLEL